MRSAAARIDLYCVSVTSGKWPDEKVWRLALAIVMALSLQTVGYSLT